MTSFVDLPYDLILKVLTSSHITAIDLVNVKLTSKFFGLNQHDLFKSLADHAASRLCSNNPTYDALCLDKQNELVERCEGNWSRVLWFLHSIVESCAMVKTSRDASNNGERFTMVIKDSKVYSCGTSVWALGHGKETRRCFELKHIDLPFSAQVIQVSASDYNVAFLMQSGEVFTYGYNALFSCGHVDTDSTIYRPKLVEALKRTPCKQVATGNFSTVFLTREGHVYTVGGNLYGQLGHGDTLNRQVPSMVELLKKVGLVIHISAGPYYDVLAVTEDGSVYSFGNGSDLCLGNGYTRDEQLPYAIQAFKTKGVHILRVCAGDEHAVAIDSNGYVYTWGRCDIGALGHGDENDKPTPEVLLSLKKHIAVQVCARKRKTFVVVEDGLVYGFGALGYGSLGFGHGGIIFHAVEKPRVLECLRPHRVLQVSTGKVHTVVITLEGQLFGFGDNESYQLGLHSILSSKEPTEICINCQGRPKDS